MPEQPAHRLDVLQADLLPLGLLTLALDGTVRHANRTVADWLGVAASELAGRHVDQVLTAGGRVLFHTHLLPMVRLHGQVQELALSIVAAGGQPAEVLAYACIDQDGAEPLLRLVLASMRERRRVETELMRVQRAADAAPAVLFEHLVDADRGRFAYASAGLQVLLGLHPDQVRADDGAWWERIHPDDRDALRRARQQSADEGQLWLHAFRARAADSQAWAWFLVRARPRVLASSPRRVVWHGTVADITRQREMERAERERDAAEQASRAKSEFLARMSHELRTPLNGIIGFARLLAQDPDAVRAGEPRRRLGIVEASGHRLLALINEVLDIARIEAGSLRLDLQPVALLPLLQRVLAVLEPMAQAAALHITLDAPAQAAVRADATRLEQVMANLLSNAVKYNRPGGRLDVRVSESGAALVVAVTDTGIGLSEAQQRQLFQPFNRLGAERTATEGTGLGLVITRSLVEAMGGRLDVSSVQGQGTTFAVSLPRTRAPEAQPAPVTRVAGEMSPMGLPRRVLYVEDNPVNALLMQAVLADAPAIELVVAADARQAVIAAREAAPQLLLLDMHLPDLDGCALLARLREQLPDVPAVAVSANAMPEDLARARAAGFTAYWTKPIDVDQVLREVAQLLAAPPAAVRT